MKVITLASKITLARIFLIVPTMILYIAGMLMKNVNSTAYLALLITACVLFALLCLTDFVDGKIARKTNTVSDLGKFLDPLADKVVVVVMLFLIVFFKDGLEIFAYNGIVITILAGLVLSRELIISVFRSIAASKKLVLAADIYGKIKTWFLDIGVASLMIAALDPVMAWLGTVTFYIGGVLAVFSGFNYVLKNKQVFSVPEKSKQDTLDQASSTTESGSDKTTQND